MLAFRGLAASPAGEDKSDSALFQSRGTLDREANDLEPRKSPVSDNVKEHQESPSSTYAQFFPADLNDTDDEDQTLSEYAQFFPDDLNHNDDEDQTISPHQSDSEDKTKECRQSRLQAAFTLWPVPFIKPSLTNEIHPLLARSQFLNEGDNWYQLLGPTMRLASRVLKMPALVKHVIVVVDGELRTDTGSVATSVRNDLATLRGLREARGRRAIPNMSRHAKPSQETVTPAMEERAEEILAEMTDHVRLRFAALPIDIHGQIGDPEASIANHFDAARLNRSSLIEINDSLFLEISDGYTRRTLGQP